MPAVKALSKKAETLAVMPDAFDEPTALAAKQINRAAKRILTKRLLHQRRQAIHAATHTNARREVAAMAELTRKTENDDSHRN